MTAVGDGAFAADVAAYVNGVFRGSVAPQRHVSKGLILRVPAI
jgi:hypothetical protein